MSESESTFYEFDDFRLDAGKRVLLCRGEPLPLRPRVFDTLLYFVRNCGRVIDKDELMRAIWPDSFVEENNLSQNVSTLRRVLGKNRYIVTVPGSGYRFAATVKTVNPPAATRRRSRSLATPRRWRATGHKRMPFWMN